MSFNRAVLWTTLTIAIYCIAHWMWYLGTPLGISPALDGQENLLLAKDIATGRLADEPFYRAMLYPALLALLGKLTPNLVTIASLLGLISHLANAVLAMLIADCIWKNRLSTIIAGILVGLNPVLIHFAADPLDITIATTFSLSALYLFIKNTPLAGWKSMAASGLLFSLACLARPHFFAVAIIGLSTLSMLAIAKRFPSKQLLAFFAGLAIPCAIYGAANLTIGGSFSILPWQGAYNLWVSNKPGANGLYYTQSLNFHYTSEHKNPNRMESEALYKIETGNTGTIAERGAYWRSKTIESILESPGSWIGRMSWKTYALVNDWEQYNNKTFAFHKARSPILRMNPIGWGLIFALSLCGFIHLCRNDRSKAILFATLALSFAAGILLYMASGRFRAPLVPYLAILGSGVPIFLNDKRQRVFYGAIFAAALVLSFSSFGEIRSKKTFIQDSMLLADVSAKLGRDREAFEWATAALEQNEQRDDARRIQLISYYNLAATRRTGEVDAKWEQFFELVNRKDFEDPAYQLVKGIVLVKQGRLNDAFENWSNAFTQFGTEASASLAMRIVLDPKTSIPDLPQSLIQEMRGGRHGLLAYSLITKGLGPRINLQMTEDRINALRESLDAIFSEESI